MDLKRMEVSGCACCILSNDFESVPCMIIAYLPKQSQRHDNHGSGICKISVKNCPVAVLETCFSASHPILTPYF
ncbi:hypothetical protein VTO42DRAFT_7535 [Malbranchea cinnamomea]